MLDPAYDSPYPFYLPYVMLGYQVVYPEFIDPHAAFKAEYAKEGLFTWPLNFFPYQREEGMQRNFPFPNYENGDLFLSWGELAVRAYARYDAAVALKYVKNILARYDEDGLSFQRYERKSQRGNKFAFAMFSDTTGQFEAVVFSDTLAQCRDLLEPGTAVLLNVVAERDGDAVKMRVEGQDQPDFPLAAGF